MRKRILKQRPVAYISDSLVASDYPPLLQRIFAARHIEDAQDVLQPSLKYLLPYHSLSGIKEAVFLLADHIERGSRLLIVGDFDADGATSSALAVRSLRAMGAAQVDFLVPNRFEFGYGLSPEIVEVAAEMQPDLLITVDNGISSIQGVAAAKEKGWDVLVTDHHLAGEMLPAADAIVNPNQAGDRFPSKSLAGVGVIFYVLLALHRQLEKLGWYQAQGIATPKLADYLDIVALGTVADVVPLDRNNRILVEQGIRRMRAGQVIPGIKALLEVGGRDLSRLVSSDLGFAVGPRLNAAGRLDDMSIGIRCLLTDDAQEARAIAEQLNELNKARKEIENQMKDEALEALWLLQKRFDGAQLPTGLALFEKSWHQGVIGILASRIKDLWHRPVIAFALGGHGELKGSARSIEGCHIRDVLAEMDSSHPGLIAKFGGHAMAAGLSLAAENFADFAQVFDATVSRHLDDQALQEVILHDGELANTELDLSLARQLKFAAPWGQAFPEPVFTGVFQIVDRRIVGEKHLKLKLATEEGLQVDAIQFFYDPEIWDGIGFAARLAYRLDVNLFRDQETLQLQLQYAEAV